MPTGKKADTWDLLSMMQNPADDAKKIASIGQQALAMGVVSPEDAMREVQNISRDVSPILKKLQIGADPKAQILAMNTDTATALMNQRRAEMQGEAEGAPSVPSGVPGVFSKIQVPMLPEPQLKPIPKGSGLEQSDEATGKAGGRTNVQRMLTMSPDEWQSSYESAMQTPAIQEQMKGINDIRDLLAMEAQAPAQLNLAPLAALTDSLTGSKLLAGYTVPQDRQKRLADYMLKIQDDRKDLAKTIIDAIGKQKAGTMQEMLYQDFINKKAAEAKDPNALVKPLSPNAIMSDLRIKEKDVRDSVNKTMEPLETGYNQLLNAKESLDRNDYQSAVGMLSVLAKNVGADSGALSNQDLNRWLPRTFEGDLAKVEAYFTSNPNTEVPPELTRGLKQLIGIAARNMVDRYSKQLDRKVGQYKGSSSYKNVPLSEIVSPAQQMITDLRKYGGYDKKEGPLKNVTAPRKANSSYDGSTALPADASLEMKKMRADFLRKKKGGG